MFHTRLTSLRASTALALLLIAANPAVSGPTGGQVVGGDVSISSPDANTTVIDQSSSRGIIEWDRFDVDSGEQLRFDLPSSDAITLNRVTGGHGPSAINGRIDSNGRIIISNRDGIVFGDGAVIDVGALIATTADIENDAFMNGSLEFGHSGSRNGSVINRGSISAKDGGLIALVAPHAENSGILSARVGRVAVAGGDRFTIDFTGSEFLRLAIDPASPAAEYLATNSGRIEAEGGHVLLTTQTASDALTGVVNNSGIVEATAVDTSGGRIRLVAGGGAKVRNSGTVRSRGKTGGTIEITAEAVELTSTSVVDASGDEGGGTILVGGDYLGGNAELAARNPLSPRLEEYPVYSASTLVAETGATVHADALSFGDGGKVIFWSDNYTLTDATITARGGLSFGDGGFVETSGGVLDVRTAADTSAPNGDGGTWLLDPRDITIVDGATDVADVFISDDFIVPADDADTEVSSILIEARLNAGQRVVVSTFDTTGSEQGDITVEGDITKSRGDDAELWLLAEDDIIIRTGVDIESNANELDIFLVARDRISAGSMGELDTNGGFLGLRSGDDITIDTRSRMPEMAITNLPEFAASRVDVELDFDDDHVEFSYTDDQITVPTGGFQLLEFSGGPIYIDMDGDRTVSISDRSFLLQDGRSDSFQFNHTSSYGVEASDALNGIPEVINFPTSDVAPFGENPPSAIVPVVEVSNDEGLTVDRLVAASPEGEAMIAALAAGDEPAEPEPPVEAPEPEAPMDEPSVPETPAEGANDSTTSDDELMSRISEVEFPSSRLGSETFGQSISSSVLLNESEAETAQADISAESIQRTEQLVGYFETGFEIKGFVGDLKYVVEQMKIAVSINDLEALKVYSRIFGFSPSASELTDLQNALRRQGLFSATTFVAEKLIDLHWPEEWGPKSIAKLLLVDATQAVITGRADVFAANALIRVGEEYVALSGATNELTHVVLDSAISNLNALEQNPQSLQILSSNLQLMLTTSNNLRAGFIDWPPSVDTSRKIRIIQMLTEVKANEVQQKLVSEGRATSFIPFESSINDVEVQAHGYDRDVFGRYRRFADEVAAVLGVEGWENGQSPFPASDPRFGTSGTTSAFPQL